MVDEVLRLDDVRRSYNVGSPTETEVLHGIDLVLRRGEFVALIGPSGSGKSTLLHIMGLLDRATSGRLFIEGEDTGALDDSALTRLRGRRIGFVFQYHYLITAFTALENVMMPLLVERGYPDDAMRKRALDWLTGLGLEQWRDHPANALSGGQQQRVAVARALATNPTLVLADEPTGNLDTKAAESVFALMREVNRKNGTSFLIVTHSMDIARGCDRIIELVDGQIVQHVPAAPASPAALLEVGPK